MAGLWVSGVDNVNLYDGLVILYPDAPHTHAHAHARTHIHMYNFASLLKSFRSETAKKYMKL